MSLPISLMLPRLLLAFGPHQKPWWWKVGEPGRARPSLWMGNWCMKRASCLASTTQLVGTEGRTQHPFPSTPAFLNSPSPPPTTPQLLCLKRWDHFDLAFVTAVRRTAETEQTEKNWNPPHISVLIYLFVDLRHCQQLAIWQHPQGATADSTCPFAWWQEGTFKGKPAHSAVCACLLTQTFRTYLLSVKVWMWPFLPSI